MDASLIHPQTPFFALRKGNWGAAGPGRFRGWETSGRRSGATVSVFGFPGAGEPRGVGIKKMEISLIAWGPPGFP